MYLITKDTLECSKDAGVCVLKSNGRTIKDFSINNLQNGIILDISGPNIHHAHHGESYYYKYRLFLQTPSGKLLLFKNVDWYECLFWGFFCPVLGGKDFDENSSAYVDIMTKKDRIESFLTSPDRELTVSAWGGDDYWTSMMLMIIGGILLILVLIKRELTYSLINKLISSVDSNK